MKGRTILKGWGADGAEIVMAADRFLLTRRGKGYVYLTAEELERLHMEITGYLYERDEMRSGQAAETF